MLQKTIVTIATAGLLLTTAVPAFAETASSTAMTGTSSTISVSKIQCVGAAVDTREASIGTAMTTFTAAENAAYAARAVALKAAYTQTTSASVKTAVKAAWSTFTASMKSARSAWKTAQSSAWSTYKTAAAACKVPSGISDSAHASSEASGN